LFCPSLAGKIPAGGAESALLFLQRGIARLALEPGVNAHRAHSLSFADPQICNWLTIANPPIGELCGRWDGIRNPFNLFSFIAFSRHLRLALPLLSTGLPGV
jgi:hypothetical protein